MRQSENLASSTSECTQGDVPERGSMRPSFEADHQDRDYYEEKVPWIPIRSRLFCLQPVGFGTSYIESLSSYLGRLADAHCLSPARLVMGLLEDSFPHPHGACSSYGVSRINGYSLQTQRWVSRLEQLTRYPNLRALTMLNFAHVLSFHHLLRSKLAWCSACYAEWAAQGHPVYQPLIWQLQAITVCLRHECRLNTECPNTCCGKRLPLFTPRFRAGWCPYCGVWLGDVMDDQSVQPEEFAWQHWTTQVMGDLLAASAGWEVPLSTHHWEQAMHRCLQEVGGGHPSRLAAVLKMNARTVRLWTRHGLPPTLELLLYACYCLSTTPRTLLAGDEAGTPAFQLRLFNLEALPIRKRTRRSSWTTQRRLAMDKRETQPASGHHSELGCADGVSQRTLGKSTVEGEKRSLRIIQTRLRAVAHRPYMKCPSPEQVAIRLGRPLSELRQMFPELLKKISRNFDQWRRAHRKLLHDRVEESRRQLFPVGRLRGISD